MRDSVLKALDPIVENHKEELKAIHHNIHKSHSKIKMEEDHPMRSDKKKKKMRKKMKRFNYRFLLLES